MHLTPEQVCDAEYSAARNRRCAADHKKARPSLPAPARPDQRRSTNQLTWLHIALFLDQLPKRQGGQA